MWLRTGYRWLSAHPFLVDLTLSVLLLFFLVIAGAGATNAFYLPLTAAQVLPLAVRRIEPFTAALLVAAGALAQVVLVDDPLGSNVAVLIVIYSVAAHSGQRWKSLCVLGLGFLGSVVAAVDWLLFTDYPTSDNPLLRIAPATVVLAMTVTTAWVLGDVVRRRRAVIARLREQNEALARDRAQREAIAASGERASIAREMHDIVAHSLSVVVVQADGGAYAARAALGRDTDSDADRRALDRAAQTLETLAATAREALTDTRRLVGVLRESGSAAEYAPAQGLGHLADLVQRLRVSGVPVELTVRGDLATLSRDLDLAAYRVAQESLTNVLKHAGRGATASVDVLRTPAVLLVRITDDGAGRGTGDGLGNGIIGMRERVEVLGGTLYAGPRTAGGFEVVASLPVRSGGGTGQQAARTDGAGVE